MEEGFMKKYLAIPAVLCLAASLLTACGGGKGETTAADTKAEQGQTAAAEKETAKTADGGSEQITLRFSWWGGEERLAATLDVIKQFEELNPNIKIEPEYGSSDGYADKLATQLASGTAPDIIQIDPGLMPALVSDETNYFLDLNTSSFDFSNFDENYYKLRINGFYDGKQLGIPTGISGGAVLVNQGLADQIGIDFHTQYTWDDIFDWAKKVREYDDSMYLICSNKDYVANILANNYAKQLSGKTFINEETKEINLTSEQWQEVYTFVKRLYDEEVIAPASYSAAYSGDNMQSDPNWIAGKYVCSFTYMSTMETLAAANADAEYTAGLFPLYQGSDVDAWNANCPQIIAINAKSKNPEAAVEFLDYFFNNEKAMETLGCTRSVPPTAKAREICTADGSLSKLLSEAADVAGSYSGMVDDKYFSAAEAKQIVTDEVEAVGFGVTTPESASEETISLLNNYISGIQ
ncbi:extracellular solute-binding protein [Hungatella hathewayi]|jgi:oligogalacturonide transport system substrate-binding protein|uniref:Extracellular solute-binding protein n=2 Tax=Lachnospirales TaxID=3085636 RepID=A0A374P3N0_9FIRM|nr:extracellular solute-binding protein [Hungatella hathewayi]RGK97395.1 extracellular solute-binding protein [Hungatella hathewayi]RGO75303.1 extracellular solute-binding protein [Hungatella hathewayi]RHC52094.1 extracellular solute-binding protein [Hungatella hathewayi]